MDRLGSEAVEIGICQRRAKALETDVGGVTCDALHVATITQEACSSIHIAAPSSQVFALLLLKPRHPTMDKPQWISAMAEKTSSMVSENDCVCISFSEWS